LMSGWRRDKKWNDADIVILGRDLKKIANGVREEDEGL
jgi:hypothetical protein